MGTSPEIPVIPATHTHTHLKNKQRLILMRSRQKESMRVCVCSAVVGVCVPDTDGTSQPPMCRIVCGTVCVCVHVAYRESAFWVH